MVWINNTIWIYKEKKPIEKACSTVRYLGMKKEYIGGGDVIIDVYLARKALNIPYREMLRPENVEKIWHWCNGVRS